MSPQQIHFRYRYVPFGTRFQPMEGVRTAGTADEHLYANELVTDVGNVCWGYQGETRAIIDHHFQRPDQIPSATAAVLHLAGNIAERWKEGPNSHNIMWLVTHREPDFDAFCSMYLARGIISGEIGADWTGLALTPEGWNFEQSGFDWFHPPTDRLSSEQRWPVLLAQYASMVDNCSPLYTSLAGSLHSTLYAAMLRGRDYLQTGAKEFFDLCRDRIRVGMNPCFDNIMADEPRFVAEQRLLALEEQRYNNDLHRAHRAVVFLPTYPGTFAEFFESKKAVPLLDGAMAVRPEHLPDERDSYVQTDAIFLRDPTCLMFKEWARTDTVHSALGLGFTLTAIAYSKKKQYNLFNNNDYYFALDPEHSGRRHLYYAWAALQAAEVTELRLQNYASAGRPRTDFLQRAGDHPGWFTDPWFDGSNYNGSIVVTPFQGTVIAPPGTQSNLFDDEVARLVRNALETGPFTERMMVSDISLVDGKRTETLSSFSAVSKGALAEPGEHLRFASLLLSRFSEAFDTSVTERLGRSLWRVLDPKFAGELDHEVLLRHLVREGNWVGVWTRQGIAVVYRREAEKEIAQIRDAVTRLANLLVNIGGLTGNDGKATDFLKRLNECQRLSFDALDFERQLAFPSLFIVDRLFEAVQARRMLDSLTHLAEVQSNLAMSEQMVRHTHTLARVQSNLELFEVVLAFVYGGELTHILLEAATDKPGGVWWVAGGSLFFGLIALFILKPYQSHE